MAWAPPVFPNAPGFKFGDPYGGRPPPQLPGPNIPRGGILESLRYLGRQPGQTPYAGILEGLRDLGRPPAEAFAAPNGGIPSASAVPGLSETFDYVWPQAFFGPQASTSTPTAASDARRPLADYSTGEIAGDVAKSFGIGTGRGVIHLLGLGGDLREAIGTEVQKAADYLAPGLAPNIGAKASDFLATNQLALAWNPLLAGPTSAQIQDAVESFTGPFYQPKTVPGDYAQTVGEFLPGAMLVPEGSFAARALRHGLVPALSAETAGQLTKGTAAEPWARTVAAFLAPPANALKFLGPRGIGRLVGEGESNSWRAKLDSKKTADDRGAQH